MKIMKVHEVDIIGRKADEFFAGNNAWILEKVTRVEESKTSDVTMDALLAFGGENISVNLTVLPLVSAEKKKLGSMIVFDDITSEKRMKSTMSRYMGSRSCRSAVGGGRGYSGRHKQDGHHSLF